MRQLPLVLLLVVPLIGCANTRWNRVVHDLPDPVVRLHSPTPPRTYAQHPRPADKPAPAPRTPAPRPPQRQAIRNATVVVDAGHGGKDPGAWQHTRSRIPEKTIVLDVANELADDLRQRGARVVTTRTTDVFIELDDRANTAERHRADLFVSIHANSATRASASGLLIYIARGASPESERAAHILLNTLKRAGFQTLGVHPANYRVLVGHTRPAVLVECGFLTNVDDARKLATDSYRDRLASVLAEGIASYLAR